MYFFKYLINVAQDELCYSKHLHPLSLSARPKIALFENSKVIYLLNEKELDRAISPGCRSRQAPSESRSAPFAARALFVKSTFEFIIGSKNRK